MRRQASVTLNQTPENLCDNGIVADRGTYWECSPLARLSVYTTAQRVTVWTYNNIVALVGTLAGVGVWVNGVPYQTVVPPAEGDYLATVELPPGGKVVDLVAGGQTYTGVLCGTFLKRVRFVGGVTRVERRQPVDRIVVYGDSIGCGFNSAQPDHQSAAAKLRRALGRSLLLEAYGYRALQTDCADAAARTTFAAYLASLNPVTLWLQIGTNDYGRDGGLWSAADFGTAYADLLDKFHAVAPDCAVYCQTPFVRSSETANANHSNTLADYRTEIATASGARAWTTLVDGTTILANNTIHLADGLHPTTIGQGLWAFTLWDTLAPGTRAIILSDTFAGVNGTALSLHDPEYGTGWNAGTTWKISGNQTTSTTAGAWAFTDLAVSDLDFSADMLTASGESYSGLVVRYSDNNNHWLIQAASNGKWKIREVNGGAYTDRATSASSFSAGTLYRVRVTAVGQTITVYVDGTQVCQYASAALNESSSLVGFYHGADNAAWGNAYAVAGT